MSLLLLNSFDYTPSSLKTVLLNNESPNNWVCCCCCASVPTFRFDLVFGFCY
ncbi:hypothetical protein MtrunA17_Chr7g0249191 [Medicago truncatula]|uniref:Uncharacterized protein n=1 Tax=Medicago truncatula TaxID=3880 RepID=A0A396H162_MEDTR|nr:hypothetical protein MtrunA17_Chr7g0249191 [Medicago truncatula]